MAKIEKAHCENCGSTDPENTNTATDPEFQGYSRCCNEPVVTECWDDPEGGCSHGKIGE